MTIRRSLFFSNILMLVIPVILSVLVSFLILFVFTGRSANTIERAFPKAIETIAHFQQTGDEQHLLTGVKEFNDQFQDQGAMMMVLRANRLLYPDRSQLAAVDNPVLMAALSNDVTGNLTINHTQVLIERHKDYRLVLVNQQRRLGAEKPAIRPLTYQILILLLTMVAVIIVTNRMLTHLITRRITAALRVLAGGAREIRDGNLRHRIRYERKDEFAPVCEDFNEMADHLQTLIDRQQRDEASRKELLAGISHDLRTPLTSIRAYVEGLLDGVAEDLPSQMKYLSIIRSKAEDIDHIVDKLFLFSKLEIGEYPFSPEQIDLGEQLTAMAESINTDYGSRGVQVRLVNCPDGQLVYLDPVQLQNALSNILENSVKYGKKDQCHIEVECFDAGDRITLWMTDDGPGVPEESLDKLFDVFYRSDPSRQNPSRGSGLGLAITAKILGRMGGSIRAENAPRGGLRLILSLPKFNKEANE